MPSDLFKRSVDKAKKLFKTGRASSKKPLPPQVPPQDPLEDPPEGPPEDPSSHLPAFHEPVMTLPPQLPPLSEQPTDIPQAAPTASQPGPSTSHWAANDTEPANAQSRLATGAKKAGAEAWAGLRATLQLLEKSSSIFPPIKSAVAEFLGVVGTFETAARNRGDYAELAMNLQNVVQEFALRPGEHTSSRVSEALQAMSSGLEKEMEHVHEQQQRSGLSRHVGAGQDAVDVRGCYRRVEALRHELQNKALIDIWRNQEEQKTDARLKELNAALKAMYDSSLADVVGRRTCTPGTREAILAEMRQWVDSSEGPKVYWLNGMAGTGKTTLAYSFCDEMRLAGRLGASFFCSRTDPDSRTVSKIVPTIAHQLARLLPLYREALLRQIGEDKEIGARRTETQFEKLIRDPLRQVGRSESKEVVVTIDALDECDRRDGAQDILNTLLRHARDLPIKFLVTCRPEPGLFDVLDSKSEDYRTVLHLHNVDASSVQADIKKYLAVELGQTSLPPEKLRMLAEQAGSLFIYAATAVRYICPQNRKVNVEQRLESLLSITAGARTNKHKGIDELYATVVASSLADEELDPQERENIRLVLDTTVCARELMSAGTMAELLKMDDEQTVLCALQHLRSVLHVAEGTGQISALHASFLDFMLDRERSRDLWCNAAEHHRLLALGCLSSMLRLLRFNICELKSSFVLDEDIPDLARKVDKAITPELFYACRHWGDHIASAEPRGDVQRALDDFLTNRLLFWTEVLNLRNCVAAGAQMLTQVHRWLQVSSLASALVVQALIAAQKVGSANDMAELALDASRFLTAFGLSSASCSTPHIYISALPFWPEARPVRERYWKRTQRLMKLEGTGIEGRDLACLAAWSTDSMVTCVAQSSDSTRIVSGSNSGSKDKSIRVWDTHTGLLVAGPFGGHTGSVTSVAFSPDGTRIVSGSDDNSIRVWDAHTGLLAVGSFEGHTNGVASVVYSPDGTRIVSGSWDATIRVWDAHTGLLAAGPFEGHTSQVRSVGFSPDSTLIVSGSNDKTIRVWNAHTGLLVVGPFEGHSDSVYSVGFSPDGTRIVSGSYDLTVCVWDAHTGLLAAEPFEGHTSQVRSVGFSPDGTRIVSSSDDKTIRVWDAHTGLLAAGPFERHTDSVYSVGFSSDGTRIVSGSGDKTIRIWDAHAGLLAAGKSSGHTDGVLSVAFSPDGSCIVSGSYDGTVRVWNAHSGLLAAGPFEEQTGWVCSVAFSPDGTHIVSGSWDHTIRVWEAHTGLLVAGPFEGHSGPVISVGFSPDGTRIVSGSYDKTVCVWDAHTGLLAAEPFEGHTSYVSSVGFSPDGTRIVSGSYDTTIRVWEAHTGLLATEPFKGHTNWVSSAAFSPDGTRIVSGSYDSTIRVWDALTGLLAAGPLEGHTDRVNSVGVSPNGTSIVSGSDDRTIRVWDAHTGLLVAGPFERHTSSVYSVGFSPDGTCVVSGSGDNTIRVWRAIPHIPNAGHLTDWRADDSGMITTRQGELLLCAPVDLLNGLILPQNTACVCAQGVFELNFNNVLLGEQWTECYSSSNPVS